MRDRSLDQTDVINIGTSSLLSKNSNQHSPNLTSREQLIFAQSTNKYDPRQRFEQNERYRKSTVKNPKTEKMMGLEMKFKYT